MRLKKLLFRLVATALVLITFVSLLVFFGVKKFHDNMIEDAKLSVITKLSTNQDSIAFRNVSVVYGQLPIVCGEVSYKINGSYGEYQWFFSSLQPQSETTIVDPPRNDVTEALLQICKSYTTTDLILSLWNFGRF